MSLHDAIQRVLHLNVAYFGPALAGKTTNLRFLYQRLGGSKSEWMVAFDEDFYGPEKERRLVGFHFELPNVEVAGNRLCFHLSAVPGVMFYDAGRIHLLKNVDGIVFVADAQAERFDANVEMIENLDYHLKDHGRSVESVPAVMQYNKVDLPTAVSVGQMEREINSYAWPSLPAAAATGAGVVETLKALAKQLVMGLRDHRIEQKPFELLKAPTRALDWWDLFRSPVVD